MSQQVIIFDTTLRDGEQALQASLSAKEKLQIALALERMGVDVMEVGFPVSSPGDFESVQTIARTIKNSRVCALARCVEKDIDVAAQALKVADAFRIHTFIATSPMHIATKLRSTLDEVIERAYTWLSVRVITLMTWSSPARMLAGRLLTIWRAWWKPL
nr:2-isopropylmalate synthase [Salmonella sp. NCTC 7297]